MVFLLAITAGVLFAAAIYMILRRSLMKTLVGLLLLSYAINLLLFTSADLVPARPALVDADSLLPPAMYADPVPQAFILTAIVISFGLTAFAITLMRQVYNILGSDDLNEMRCTDVPCEEVEIASEEELLEEPL